MRKICVFCYREVDEDVGYCVKCHEYKGVVDARVCPKCKELVPVEEHCECSGKRVMTDEVHNGIKADLVAAGENAGEADIAAEFQAGIEANEGETRENIKHFRASPKCKCSTCEHYRKHPPVPAKR